MILCNVKGCSSNNFPLKVQPSSIQKQSSEFNPEFIKHMLPKLHWGALCSASKDLQILGVPDEMPTNISEDLTLLKLLHQILLDTHIEVGNLVCNNCGRVYPIQNGVPNMLLTEDEV